MRAAALPTLALPLLLTYCGAKQDLIIGEIAPITEAGTTSGISGGGAGAEPPVGGSVSAGTGAVGGTLGGTSEGGTTEMAGTAGVAGEPATGACVAGEEPPVDSLIHRYSFDGTGDVVVDSIGGADGTLEGPTLDGSGIATLAGNPTRQYIDLPDGLISSLTDVTLLAWITWEGGAGYQRIFDFGISDAGEVQGGSGTSYLAVMPTTGFDNGQSPGLGAEVKAAGHPTLHLASIEDIEDRFAQVALVFRSGVSAELYLDGNLLSTLTTAIQLSDIDDRNDWLGQSQWSKDHNFNGSFSEVRIYNAALSACQLHTLLVRGAENPFPL
jgi:hypothetical protein